MPSLSLRGFVKRVFPKRNDLKAREKSFPIPDFSYCCTSLSSATSGVHRFRLETGPMLEAEAWIARHRKFWKASLDALEFYLKGLSDKEEGKA